MTSDFPGGLSFGTTNVEGSRLGRSWHFYGLSEGITYFPAKPVHSQPASCGCQLQYFSDHRANSKISVHQLDKCVLIQYALIYTYICTCTIYISLNMYRWIYIYVYWQLKRDVYGAYLYISLVYTYTYTYIPYTSRWISIFMYICK